MGINIKKGKRNQDVLAHIVRIYVSTALPVSSRSVAESMGGSVSSATVRNIMAELEETGHIAQPHTSAGRVPTDRGYRNYVDLMNERFYMEKLEVERLAMEYDDRISSINDIIEMTSELISRELHQASVVMWPNIGNFRLKHLELIKVKAQTVLAVLITVTNAVKNYMIQIDRDIGKIELAKVANYINRNHEEEKVADISDSLKCLVEGGSGEAHSDIAEVAMKIFGHIVEKDAESDIYWEGLNYFADNEENSDPDVVRRMIKIFSNRREIACIMREDLSYGGIRTHIGMENKSDILRRCSVITSGYSMYGKTIGRIGVIGPTRMDYDSVLRTVGYLSDMIGLKLEELDQ